MFKFIKNYFRMKKTVLAYQELQANLSLILKFNLKSHNYRGIGNPHLNLVF
jgi:hypothetical protein